jgi:hypothetical protein
MSPCVILTRYSAHFIRVDFEESQLSSRLENGVSKRDGRAEILVEGTARSYIFSFPKRGFRRKSLSLGRFPSVS